MPSSDQCLRKFYWLTTFREKMRMHWKFGLVMGVKNDSEGCALSGTLVRRTRGHHVCIAHRGWHHCILTEGCKASKCAFHLMFPKLSPPSHGGYLAYARFSWTWISFALALSCRVARTIACGWLRNFFGLAFVGRIGIWLRLAWLRCQGQKVETVRRHNRGRHPGDSEGRAWSSCTMVLHRRHTHSGCQCSV